MLLGSTLIHFISYYVFTKKISTVIFSTAIFLLQYCNQVSVNEIWTLHIDFFFVYFDAFNDVCIAKLNNESERMWMETAQTLFESLSLYLPGRKTEDLSLTSRASSSPVTSI